MEEGRRRGRKYQRLPYFATHFECELKLAESAIYADSPHEIGLVLFE